MNALADERRESVILKLATDTLASHGELRFVARGSSMLPSIMPGDVLMIRSETVRNVHRGDVVLCLQEGRFRAHRLMDKTEKAGRFTLLTRGDALLQNDPPVGEDALLGRVATVVRGGKRIRLAGHLSAGERLLRWTVRRSDAAVAWLLRWHSVRARIRSSSAAFAKIPPETGEFE